MQNSDIVDVVGLTPVPSPVPSSLQAPEAAAAASAVAATAGSDSGRIRCVCDQEDDDGFTIQCDSCMVWQHAGCVGIARNNVPEVYLCEQCRPEDADVETPTSKHRKRQATPKESVNEIGQNIVSSEALPELAKTKDRYEGARLKMPRVSSDVSLGEINFELCELIVFPHADDIHENSKLFEVRELRSRNVGRRSGQAAKMGVFAGQSIDPGSLIGEYLGHVQPANTLMQRVEDVSHSYVLFCASAPDLVVDARRFGNALRFARRSCRANCAVKLLLTPSKDPAEAVHWCLFARNTIKENEELFLPFDYSDGNHFFQYECCCAYPELCLADDLVFPGSAKTEPKSKKPYSPSPSSTSTSHSHPHSSAISAAPDRKLSREERKLQQYVEFIERMESSVKKQTTKRSGQSGSSSISGMGSPPPPTSPKDNRRASQKSSPRTDTEHKVRDKMDVYMHTDSDTLGNSSRGEAMPELPKSASTAGSPKRVSLPLKKILSKSFTEKFRQSLQGVSVVKPDPNLVDPSSEPANISTAESSQASEIESEPQDVPHSSTAPSSTTASNPETPSKKRMSLSDYLMRRRSSPIDKEAVSIEKDESTSKGMLMENDVSGASQGVTGKEQTSARPPKTHQERPPDNAAEEYARRLHRQSTPSFPDSAVNYRDGTPPPHLYHRPADQQPSRGYEHNRWARDHQQHEEEGDYSGRGQSSSYHPSWRREEFQQQQPSPPYSSRSHYPTVGTFHRENQPPPRRYPLFSDKKSPSPQDDERRWTNGGDRDRKKEWDQKDYRGSRHFR